MNISIKDVAKASGVSPATASRVLGHSSHQVSEETRRRVLDAAKRLNYRPNLSARSLSSKSTRLLQMFLNFYESESEDTGAMTSIKLAVQGVNAAAEAANYKVLFDIEYAHRLNKTKQLYFDFPIAGALVWCPRANDPIIDLLAESGIPFVVIGTSAFRRHSFVDTDNVACGFIATEHLISLGHRKIACLGGPLDYLPSLDCVSGYHRALRKYGIQENRAWELSANWTVDNGYKMTLELFGRKIDLPTAIFAGNDMLATGALIALKQLGLAVPEDVGVVGIDDFPGAKMTDPPLTTLHNPIYEGAELGTRRLIQLIEQSDDGSAINGSGMVYQDLVEPRLVVRESCGAHLAKVRCVTTRAQG